MADEKITLEELFAEQRHQREIMERIEKANKEDHEGIIARLDKMNGRTDELAERQRTTELEVASLKERQRTLAVVTNVAAAIEAAAAGIMAAIFGGKI